MPEEVNSINEVAARQHSLFGNEPVDSQVVALKGLAGLTLLFLNLLAAGRVGRGILGREELLDEIFLALLDSECYFANATRHLEILQDTVAIDHVVFLHLCFKYF